MENDVGEACDSQHQEPAHSNDAVIRKTSRLSRRPGALDSCRYNSTDLYHAIQDGDPQRAQFLLDSGLDPLDTQAHYYDDDGNTYDYITVAAESASLLPVLRVILEHIKNAERDEDDAMSKSLQRAIFKATEASNTAAITVLFNALPENLQETYIFTMEMAMRLAAESWSSDTVDQLIQIDLLRTNKVLSRDVLSGALLAAAQSSVAEFEDVEQFKHTIASLKQAGANLNVQEVGTGYSMIHFACEIDPPCQSPMLQILTQPDLMVNPWLRDNRGRVPIFAASESGSFEAFTRVLYKTGTVDEIRDNEGNTPLHFASTPKKAQYLFEWGCDLWAENQKGETALHLRSRAGANEVVKYLLDMLAMPMAPDAYGWNSGDCMDNMIARRGVSLANSDSGLNNNDDPNTAGGDVSRFVNARTHRGWTPLLLAQNLTVIQYLLKKGACLTEQTDLGWTALHCAVDRGNDDMVLFLLSNESGLDIKAALMATAKSCPMRNAFSRDDRDYKYLENGTLTENETPLHWAVVRERQTVEILINKAKETSMLNLMLEATDSTGATPLIRAIASNGIRAAKTDIVNTLIAEGASLDAKDRDGHDAFWWAKERGYKFTREGVFSRVVNRVGPNPPDGRVGVMNIM